MLKFLEDEKNIEEKDLFMHMENKDFDNIIDIGISIIDNNKFNLCIFFLFFLFLLSISSLLIQCCIYYYQQICYYQASRYNIRQHSLRQSIQCPKRERLGNRCSLLLRSTVFIIIWFRTSRLPDYRQSAIQCRIPCARRRETAINGYLSEQL